MVSNNVKYNVPMQALGQSMPTGVPMQGADMQGVKDAVNDTAVARRVQNSEESPFKLPLILLSWLGLNEIADRVNRSFSGDFEKTSFAKVGTWADKSVEKFKTTQIGKIFEKFGNKISKGANRLTQKNKTAFALKNYSTSPEWDLARFSFEGLNGFLSTDVKMVFDNLLKPIDSPIALEQYGMPRKEIDAFYDTIKNLPKAAQKEALHKAELKALGVSEEAVERICKNYGTQGMNRVARLAKIKKLGFNSAADFSAWQKDAYANKQMLYDALQNADKNLKINGWRDYKVLGSKKLGKIFSRIKGRQVTITEIRNKYHVILNKGAKTKLGRSLQKGMGWLLEGTTGRFGGGKFIPLMMAMIVADSLINTFKAPKGEKVKTMAERQINDFSYVFSLPLGVMAMHKVGGLKYKGMTPDEVKSYRTALETFKNKYASGFYNGKRALRKADAKAVNGMLKKGFFQKIGRLMNIGNETTAVGGAKFLRNCVGVPLRLLLSMYLLSPFIANTCTKLSHLIFGRPTKSILDEETEPQIPPEEAMAQIRQRLNQYPNTQNQSPTNLINMLKNGQSYYAPANPFARQVQIQPQKDLQNAAPEPVRTYIPSPEGVKVKGEDTSPAEKAIARSQSAEKSAMDILSGKFSE